MRLSWQPGHIYLMSACPTQNWREGEEPATDLTSFTRSAKASFPSDYPLIIFNAIILEFGACLAQKRMAQEQP